METKNLYQRMAAITEELATVAKNLNVETGKGKSYKAVSERDIIDAVKPLEAKHGVYSYPAGREVLESRLLESESTYNGNTTKKTTFFTRIRTTYRFVNVDNPEDYIETTTFAEGIDTQDKGSGKAMTYADKYALMKAYKISTGDDPDQTASAEESYAEPKTIDESLAERVMAGLAYMAGDKVADQSALLKELTGKSNVYKLTPAEATAAVLELRERAKAKE